MCSCLEMNRTPALKPSMSNWFQIISYLVQPITARAGCLEETRCAFGKQFNGVWKISFKPGPVSQQSQNLYKRSHFLLALGRLGAALPCRIVTQTTLAAGLRSIICSPAWTSWVCSYLSCWMGWKGKAKALQSKKKKAISDLSAHKDVEQTGQLSELSACAELLWCAQLQRAISCPVILQCFVTSEMLKTNLRNQTDSISLIHSPVTQYK